MAAALADSLQDKDIEVKVQIAGENVIVDVILAVPATRQEVWIVLTDFEHMADFVSNLKESKVVSISGDTLTIFQRGAATYGLISFSIRVNTGNTVDPFR